MAFEHNTGTNKLASVINERLVRQTNQSLIVDFGTIQPNGCLQTNTFPVPVADYTLCEKLESVSPGDRVLVIWVQSEAVIIDRLLSAAGGGDNSGD